MNYASNSNMAERFSFLRTDSRYIRDILLKCIDYDVDPKASIYINASGVILPENMIRDAIWCFEPNITIGDMLGNPDWIQFTTLMPKQVESAKQWIQDTDFSPLDDWIAAWSVHEI